MNQAAVTTVATTPVDGRVPVWSAAVRLCHWGLAGCVVFDWFFDDGGPVHRWVGYAAAAFVLLRWAVGLRQTGAARLRDMLPSLRGTLAYTRLVLQGGAPRHAGHDPLGLWMVWLLWALVLALGVTGWMSRLDAFWGDETLDLLHALLADALAIAVLLHLAGVLLMSWQWRENLPWAMVIGRKRPLQQGADTEPR
jgi:cytochrome b